MANNDVERFIEYAYANNCMLHKSLLASIDSAIGMLGNRRNQHVDISRARNRIACGEPIGSAIAMQVEASRLVRKEKLRCKLLLSYLNAKDFGAGITDAHREMVAERNARANMAYGSVQKYLTANMLFSTILPSMAMFGFIGYSLIDYSNLVMFLFLFALLAVIPIIYTILQNRLRSLDA